MPVNQCRPHTEAAKRKMSLSHMGVPCPWHWRKLKLIDGIEYFECSKCHQFFPKEGFYKDKGALAGIKFQCKRCHCETATRTRDPENARRLNREHMRRVRQTNPEKIRVRERIASSKRRPNYKSRSRDIFHRALLSGKIIKPSNCSQCGKLRKVTAHHDDYSKPLEVRWLCYECHGKQTVIDNGH